MQSAMRRICRTAVISCFLFSFALTGAGWAQGPSSQFDELHQLTQALIDLSDRPPGEQSTARDLARQRHDLLLAVATTSPQEVPQFFLPPGVAKKLPVPAQPYLETDADETGTLQTVVEDYASSHKLRFFLDTGAEKLEVYFAAGAPPQLLSGSRIRGRGKRLDNFLLLQIGPTVGLQPVSSTDPAPTGGVQVLSLASPNTFGEQSTAVLLVNFVDGTSQPFLVDDVRQLVFTTVSDFDRENSQNQTWLRGDVFGWFTVPISVGACPSLTQFTSAAQQAATNAGANLSSYHRFVYMYPQNGCSFLGEATLGGDPSHAMINGNALLRVVGHEMGHNFGLFHSHSFECPGTTLGTNCQIVEYGDVFDIMGQFTGTHFNAFQKERLGWLNYGSSQPITTVTAGGVYTITPYETGTGVKALKIPRSFDSSTGLQTWYYVEYRQPTGFDSDLTAYPTSTTGVLVHSGTDSSPNSSVLLNMNPQGGFDNAALAVGESFVDATSGVSLTTKSADANGAEVDVQFGPGGCHPDVPLITITPPQSPPATAGSTQSFIVSVTNQDSAGCLPSSFLLSATAPSTPAGWTADTLVGSLKLAPAASNSTILHVTSPVGTPAGAYPVSVLARKWPIFTFSASATVTYVVSSVPVPDFAIDAPASATVQQAGSTQITITSAVSNGFSAPVAFSVSGLPAGVTASFSPAALAAPGSGTSTLTLSASASAAAGSYTATITGSSGGLAHMLTVQLSITSSPPPPPPQGSFTLFGGSATPSVLNARAAAPLELGMKFTADRGGYVSAVRFYKGTNNLGAHVGSLWASTGQLLAQANFTSETASGWQQANFAAPIAITANLVYVVSYHSAGAYSYDPGYFNSPVDNPPLHAVLNGSGGNGVYSYAANSIFPTSGAAGANFWVDVVFTSSTSTASLVSIAVTPVTPTINAGSTQQFHAVGTYSDNSTRDITSLAGWASATQAVATINSTGLASGKAAGSSLITASLGAISGTTTLTVTSVPPPPPGNTYTLFSSAAVPSVVNAKSGSPLELGMQFTADRGGYVSGLRFYKGPSNVGTHVGSLWTRTGQLLAQTTFANETASGWQQADLPSPVPINANTVYMISYHSAGYYSYDLGYFNSAVDNPPLHAVVNSTGNNGAYSYGATSTFPATGAAGANFWVDVVFTTGVSTASLVSIAVTPPNASIAAGATLQFQATGTYSDNSTRDLTGQVGWTSATPVVGTISAAGLATGISVGSSQITATLGAISGTTTLYVTSAPPPPSGNTYSLFNSGAIPATANANAGSPLELGMRFTAERNGKIVGIRFYKGTNNVGTHVGSLWNSTGQLLAQATFTGETSSGWQQVNLPAPVAITANTVYVVSYHSPGGYSYNLAYFNTPVDNPPLHAVVNNADSNNGVYSFAANSTFPTASGAGSNFWVDVVFQ